MITVALLLLTTGCQPSPNEYGFGDPVHLAVGLPIGPVLSLPDGALYFDGRSAAHLGVDGTVTVEHRTGAPERWWASEDGAVHAYNTGTTLALHRDPSGAWEELTIPVEALGSGSGGTLSGTSRADVWLDPARSVETSTTVAHHDGTAWSAVDFDADITSIMGRPLAVRRGHEEIGVRVDGAWQWLDGAPLERVREWLGGELACPDPVAIEADLVVICADLDGLVAHDLLSGTLEVIDPTSLRSRTVHRAAGRWYAIHRIDDTDDGCIGITGECASHVVGYDVTRLRDGAWEEIAHLPPEPGWTITAVGHEAWAFSPSIAVRLDVQE